MDADDIGAMGDAERRRRQGGLESLGGRQVEDTTERGLAARPEQDRPAEDAQEFELAEHLEVVLGRLPEPEPWIDDEIVPPDPESQRPLDRALEVGDELGQERGVARLFPVVHDDQGDPVVGREARERVIGTDAPDVVDHVRSRDQRSLGDCRLRRVDADRDVRQDRAERLDHGEHAPALLVEIDRAVPRPGRFAADIEDVRPGGDHLGADPHGCLDRALPGEQAVTRERIGRDVEDAHHERALAPAERRPPDARRPRRRRRRRGCGRHASAGSIGHGRGGPSPGSGSRRSGSSTRRARATPTR